MISQLLKNINRMRIAYGERHAAAFQVLFAAGSAAYHPQRRRGCRNPSPVTAFKPFDSEGLCHC